MQIEEIENLQSLADKSQTDALKRQSMRIERTCSFGAGGKKVR